MIRPGFQNPCANDPPVVQSECSLCPCSHEERVMLHAAKAASQRYKNILIITNDTMLLSWPFVSSVRVVQRNCGCHLELARS